jgi:hypothetical protein
MSKRSAISAAVIVVSARNRAANATCSAALLDRLRSSTAVHVRRFDSCTIIRSDFENS